MIKKSSIYISCDAFSSDIVPIFGTFVIKSEGKTVQHERHYDHDVMVQKKQWKTQKHIGELQRFGWENVQHFRFYIKSQKFWSCLGLPPVRAMSMKICILLVQCLCCKVLQDSEEQLFFVHAHKPIQKFLHSIKFTVLGKILPIKISMILYLFFVPMLNLHTLYLHLWKICTKSPGSTNQNFIPKIEGKKHEKYEVFIRLGEILQIRDNPLFQFFRGLPINSGVKISPK